MSKDSKGRGVVRVGKKSKRDSGSGNRREVRLTGLEEVRSGGMGGELRGKQGEIKGRATGGLEVVILDPYPVVASGLSEWLSADFPGASICVAACVGGVMASPGGLVRRVWVVEVVDERGVADWGQLDGVIGRGGAAVVFSRSSDPGTVHEAIRRGATSYVHKTEGRDALKHAVLRAVDGHLFVSEAAAPCFLAQIRSPSSAGPAFEQSLQGIGLLTGREREVMTWLGQACSTRRIAMKLGVSAKTVEAHAANIRGKLHLRSMRELLRAAALLRGEESPALGRGAADGAGATVR